MCMEIYRTNNKLVSIYHDDAIHCYDKWDKPVVIIADGPYGVGGFPGDPPTPKYLGEWYAPHIEIWSKHSTPLTTLWFWNTEIGWANVHPVLEKHGWDYVSSNIWDKGLGHIAGNANTKTLRRFPVVSELCVLYTKRAEFKVKDKNVSMKDWLRHEWKRSGLPFSKANEACGVIDAATRKYLTSCHLWYFPPSDAFGKLSHYANKHGMSSGKPYFSINGKTPITVEEWGRLRTKFYCPFGFTNVWREPALNGKERLKIGTKAVHLNQKPLKFMNMIIKASSDEGDMVWEPFGGLCSGVLSAYNLNRRGYAAEINETLYKHAIERFQPSNSFI